TIVTIRLIFSTVHGSIRFSCSEASRGGRRFAFFDRRPESLRGAGLLLGAAVRFGPEGAPTGLARRAVGGAGPFTTGVDIRGTPAAGDGPEAGAVPRSLRVRPVRRRPRPHPHRHCGRWPRGCRSPTGSSAALPWSGAWSCEHRGPGSG